MSAVGITVESAEIALSKAALGETCTTYPVAPPEALQVSVGEIETAPAESAGERRTGTSGKREESGPFPPSQAKNAHSSDAKPMAYFTTTDFVPPAATGEQAFPMLFPLHQATFRNRVLEQIPLVGEFGDIRIPTDGGDYTVNRGSTSISDPGVPFAHVHGAGFRAVYELGDLDASRFMQATGQSGNVLSPHYRDLNERWRDFDYVRLAGTRDDLLAAGGRLLTLVPRKPGA